MQCPFTLHQTDNQFVSVYTSNLKTLSCSPNNPSHIIKASWCSNANMQMAVYTAIKKISWYQCIPPTRKHWAESLIIQHLCCKERWLASITLSLTLPLPPLKFWLTAVKKITSCTFGLWSYCAITMQAAVRSQ